MITQRLINKVRELRRKGYSYGKISGLLGIPKSTAWYLDKNPECLKGKKKRLREWKKEQGFIDIDYSEGYPESIRKDELIENIKEVVKEVSEKQTEELKNYLQLLTEPKRDELYELIKLKIMWESLEEEKEEKSEAEFNNALKFLMVTAFSQSMQAMQRRPVYYFLYL
jgi:anion-transporting  ArsA/GET3 family ATPase